MRPLPFVNRMRATVVFSIAMTVFYASPAQVSHPPDYRGVMTIVPGIFVTPVPGAPFRATLQIVSKEILGDGSTYTRTTSARIARSTR